VRVTDDGPGFPPELCDRAFDAFTRGDQARDVRTGTAGLGLAIAKGIVAAHGGTIGIVTHAGGGAVEFTLPRDPAPVRAC
jgi:signal transduction histidine kinase